MYGMTCDSAQQNGVAVLHGNREVFHNDKEPAFKAVYDAIVEVGRLLLLRLLLQVLLSCCS